MLNVPMEPAQVLYLSSIVQDRIAELSIRLEEIDIDLENDPYSYSELSQESTKLKLEHLELVKLFSEIGRQLNKLEA